MSDDLSTRACVARTHKDATPVENGDSHLLNKVSDTYKSPGKTQDLLSSSDRAIGTYFSDLFSLAICTANITLTRRGPLKRLRALHVGATRSAVHYVIVPPKCVLSKTST